MNKVQPLPGITKFVQGYEGEPSAQMHLTRLIDKSFCGTIAPLVCMTRAELAWIPQFGPVRRSFIARRLDELGLRFRHPNEALSARAIEVFGDINSVPIQVLLLSAPNTRRNIISLEYRSSSVIRKLSSLKNFTLGDFNGKDTEMDLEQIERDFKDDLRIGFRIETDAIDLDTRLQYWLMARR